MSISYAKLWDTLNANGLSEEQLARAAKVSGEELERLRQDKVVSLSVIYRISSALKCPLEAVMELKTDKAARAGDTDADQQSCEEYRARLSGDTLLSLLVRNGIELSGAEDFRQEQDTILSSILLSIQNAFRQEANGVTHHVTVSLEGNESQLESTKWVLDNGLLRPFEEKDAPLTQRAKCFSYPFEYIEIKLSERYLYVDYVCGPRAGRGYRCDVLIENSLALFRNKKRCWIA